MVNIYIVPSGNIPVSAIESRIQSPVVVFDDLVMELILVVEGPDVVSSGQTVAKDLHLFAIR